MELLNGDRRNPNVTDFPHHISPFPATDSLLVPSPVAVVHSSDIDRQNLPPQKLRPIRASGRSPSSSHTNDLPPASGLDGTLEKFGLLVDQVCAMSGGDSEYFASPGKVETGGFHGFGDNGLQCLVADCSTRIGSGTGGQHGYPNCVEGLFEDESSSSSGDDSSDIKGNANRKRKRKTRKKLEDFLQGLVMKVMDKQEQMHKQLIETMERRERERIIREEAWRQQERERMKREKELRAQENARSLALISFIENMMGHKVETPQSLMSMIPLVENDEENNDSNISIQKDFNSDPNNKRWPEAEVQALIMLRAAMEQKFRSMGGKCTNIWDEISTEMSNMGYTRTARKCKEKWENMNKYFRRSCGSGGKKRYENSKTCSYFQELQILYKNGFVNPGNAFDHADIENETKDSNS
ncbi:trihelix transcription factor GT-2 [Euphorbia lathyris]|uniref:trihelix transcription factor GT-2 n=1 Tax=Euphorbia lathyris TaxID=212925 RepID=UPI003314413F